MAYQDSKAALTLVVRCSSCNGGQHAPPSGCAACADVATAMHQDVTWADLPSRVSSLSKTFPAATFALIVPCEACQHRPADPCGECLGLRMRAHAYPSGAAALADIEMLSTARSLQCGGTAAR